MRVIASLTAMSLLAAACSKEPNDDPSASIAAQDAAVKTEGSSFSSKVKGIRFAAVGTLPVHNGATAAACGEAVAHPRSAAGSAVQKAGWAVTGEAKAGVYDAVSFVGGFEPSTSGTCVYTDGNIALFRDGAVKAIAYGVGQEQLAIGLINAQGGLVKVYDGDVLHEQVGILKVQEDGSAVISALPAKEKVCDGRAGVPNIQGLPINRARDLLIKAGWKPAPKAEPVRQVEDGRAFDLARSGVTEVDSCSGTGMGYCAFEYQRKGARLSVTTAGDDKWPAITRHEVTCD